jgi:hypothetical protein
VLAALSTMPRVALAMDDVRKSAAARPAFASLLEPVEKEQRSQSVSASEDTER